MRSAPSSDPFGRDAAAALLSPGPKGRCACGEDRDAAMTRFGRCYACDCRQRSAPPIERHHLFGRRSPTHAGIVIDLPVNEHRCLDALRMARPPTLREPSGNLLIDAAGFLMLVAELAEMQIAAVERRRAPQWTGPLAEIITCMCREVAEKLLSLCAVERAQ
jgi:hypothetical protein